MAPHKEERPSDNTPLEPGISKIKGMEQKAKFPSPPTFEDPLEERDYLKGRLAAAFRIFGYGTCDSTETDRPLTVDKQQIWLR